MMRFLLAFGLSSFVFAAAEAQNVTTFSGTGDTGYSVSGTALLSAQYDSPYGVFTDSKGNIYVTDENNHAIVLLTDKYYPRSGLMGGGYKDGGGTGSSLLSYPKGVAVGAGDTVFIADYGNNAIRRLDPFINLGKAQYLKTIAGGGPLGSASEGGYVDAKGLDARFEGPTSIAVSPDKSYLVVCDQTNALIRKVMISGPNYGKVTTLAGQPGGGTGTDGAALTKADFVFPEGIAINTNGDIYITDNSVGIRLLSAGNVTTIINDTKIESPSALVIAGDYLYIGNSCNIKRYNLKTKGLSTFAGPTDFTICDFQNGSGTAARFNNIGSLALSPDKKSLLITDRANNRIRSMTLPTLTAIDAVTNTDLAFTVYPNPASDHINIAKEGNIEGSMNISLFDIQGRQVINQTADASLNHFELDTKQLPNGIYILRLEGQGYVGTQRIVISK